MRRRYRDRRGEPQELDITAFMNLMVVLVPFLLITAVFSRMTVLELNLPVAADAQQEQQEQPMQLEVIVRQERLEIAYHGGARIATVAAAGESFDYARLTEHLRKVKARFPEAQSVTILLEPDVPYDIMVQVMDAVRVHTEAGENGVEVHELFPQIAIGDAPPRREEG